MVVIASSLVVNGRKHRCAGRHGSAILLSLPIEGVSNDLLERLRPDYYYCVGKIRGRMPKRLNICTRTSLCVSYSRAFVIFRDPRDVVRSAYKMRTEVYQFEKFRKLSLEQYIEKYFEVRARHRALRHTLSARSIIREHDMIIWQLQCSS